MSGHVRHANLDSPASGGTGTPAPRSRRTWGDQVDNPRYVASIGKPGSAAQATWRLGTEPAIPDTIADIGAVGQVAVCCAATRGPSHRFYGANRDDAAAVVNIANRFVGAAVADGVGSVERSGEVAKAAVASVLHHLHTLLRVEAERHQVNPESPFQNPQLVDAVTRAIRRADAALKQQFSSSPPATTLTVAALCAQPGVNGAYPYVMGRVGDSSAFRSCEGDLVEIRKELVDGGSGIESEIHSTRTVAIPGPPGLEIAVADGQLTCGELLLLTTDGLGNPLQLEEVRRALTEWWAVPPDLTSFLTQVQFRRKSYDDDRSAVAMWTPPALTGPGSRQPSWTPDEARLPSARPDRLLTDEQPLPDAMVDAGREGTLEVRVAAVRGHLHRRQAVTRCETAGAVRVGDQRVVAAVAAGVAVDESREGGHGYALREALAKAQELPAVDPVPGKAEPLADIILHVENQLRHTDIRATPWETAVLLVLVDTKPINGTYHVSCARVGPVTLDVLDTSTGVLQPAPWSQSVPMTASLESLDATEPVPIYRHSFMIRPGDALLLASDGVGLRHPHLRQQMGDYLAGNHRGRDDVPGPGEWLDRLCMFGEDGAHGQRDRAAVLIWADPKVAP